MVTESRPRPASRLRPSSGSSACSSAGSASSGSAARSSAASSSAGSSVALVLSSSPHDGGDERKDRKQCDQDDLAFFGSSCCCVPLHGIGHSVAPIAHAQPIRRPTTAIQGSGRASACAKRGGSLSRPLLVNPSASGQAVTSASSSAGSMSGSGAGPTRSRSDLGGVLVDLARPAEFVQHCHHAIARMKKPRHTTRGTNPRR